MPVERSDVPAEALDPARRERRLRRHPGPDRAAWNAWSAATTVDPLDPMARIAPAAIVARDASCFRTGPARIAPAP
jgi:hypothetical protein